MALFEVPTYVPEDEAQAAATEVAERDQEIADLRRDMHERFAEIEGELLAYRLLFGIMITMQLAIHGRRDMIPTCRSESVALRPVGTRCGSLGLSAPRGAGP